MWVDLSFGALGLAGTTPARQPTTRPGACCDTHHRRPRHVSGHLTSPVPKRRTSCSNTRYIYFIFQLCILNSAAPKLHRHGQNKVVVAVVQHHHRARSSYPSGSNALDMENRHNHRQRRTRTTHTYRQHAQAPQNRDAYDINDKIVAYTKQDKTYRCALTDMISPNTSRGAAFTVYHTSRQPRPLIFQKQQTTVRGKQQSVQLAAGLHNSTK